MARRFGATPLRLAVGSVLALAGLALVAAPASAAGPNTTTTVTESPGAVNGGPVTFTATVTHANAVPTGTVTFTVTGADSAPFTCDAGNVASLSTNPSGPGSVATCSFAGGLAASDSNYTVNAVYSGDGTFATSTGTLSAKIKKGGTTTGLVSSSNPTVTGQAVTFTASVLVTSPATGTPTGSYTFSISGTGGGMSPATDRRHGAVERQQRSVHRLGRPSGPVQPVRRDRDILGRLGLRSEHSQPLADGVEGRRRRSELSARNPPSRPVSPSVSRPASRP